MRQYSIQLTGSGGGILSAAGGVAYVAVAGGARKVPLFDKNGAAVANPVALVNGKITFYTADPVPKVDLYIQAPNGAGIVKKGVFPSGDNSLAVSTTGILSSVIIPFSIFDTVAAAETQTGFRVPTGGVVMPMPTVEVTALDAGITLEVGTLSSDAGDADGYIDVLSVATLGTKKASLANGATTMGVLLFVQDTVTAGDKAPESDVTMSNKQITYTLLAGADTAEGFIRLPVQLATAAL